VAGTDDEQPLIPAIAAMATAAGPPRGRARPLCARPAMADAWVTMFMSWSLQVRAGGVA
jgi:hypothetical protein